MSDGNSQPPFRSDGALLTAALFQKEFGDK
jgi:hypothetical protein